MADVRSLLRNERATRHIDHPQASYSATGTLECSVCHLPLKSDIEVWNKHMRSSQHAMRAERLRISSKQAPPKPTESLVTSKENSAGSRKRKADNGEDEDTRKRTKPAITISSEFPEDQSGTVFAPPPPTPPAKRVEIARPSSRPTTDASVPTPTVNEDEWAAFEASVAKEPSSEPSTVPSAITAAATITAAPLTAAELAARSREEASIQTKEKREAEIEGEKEDAARALEEEFDEMESLEERVRRLRQQREDLRNKKAKEAEEASSEVVGAEDVVPAQAASVEESEDEDDDDEDLDEWGAWGRP